MGQTMRAIKNPAEAGCEVKGLVSRYQLVKLSYFLPRILITGLKFYALSEQVRDILQQAMRIGICIKGL